MRHCPGHRTQSTVERPRVTTNRIIGITRKNRTPKPKPRVTHARGDCHNHQHAHRHTQCLQHFTCKRLFTPPISFLYFYVMTFCKPIFTRARLNVKDRFCMLALSRSLALSLSPFAPSVRSSSHTPISDTFRAVHYQSGSSPFFLLDCTRHTYVTQTHSRVQCESR